MAGRASRSRHGGCAFLVLVLVVLGGLGATFAPPYVAQVWPGVTAVVRAASDPVAVAQPAPALQPAQRDAAVAAADEAWERGDWTQAAESLEALAAADPRYAGRLCQARVKLGHALLGEAKLAEAAAQFDMALKARPGSAEALAGRELVANLDAPSVVEAPREAEAPAPSAGAAPAPASAPAVAATSACAQTTICHIVQRGENLFRLAIRFGTTVAGIKAVNGLRSDRILIGQKLLIPSCPSQAVVSAPACPAPARVVVEPVCPAPVVVQRVCPAPVVVQPVVVCPAPVVVVPVCPVVVPVCPQVCAPVCDP